MSEILQTRIPYNPLQPRRLPGIQPLDMTDWLRPDEAFAGQIAERERLLDMQRSDVLRMAPEAMSAAQELLKMVLDQLYGGARDRVQRPDGVLVELDWQDPLHTLGRIAQQDFCILQKQGDAHVLTGAVLCFPASWSLDDKFGRPLLAIHAPVDEYTPDIAARVQRLFDGVQPGRPLWRFNALWYRDAALHQPRREHACRAAGQAPYLRSELQSILRLPDSRAAVFSIHTRVVRRQDVLAQWGAPLPDPAAAV